MQAICTKFKGATDRTGSRIIATTGSGGDRISVPYDHALRSDDAHKKAAKALMKKMGWKGTLMCGSLQKGYCCVITGRGSRR